MKTLTDKELAILRQKLEFKEVSVQQLKAQLDESRKAHDQMLRTVESRAKESQEGKESAYKQVEDLKENHQRELNDLLTKFNDTRATLESQLD